MPRGVRHEYDDLQGVLSRSSGLECKDESVAIQSMANDADINVIVKRFGITGLLPVVQMPPALLGHQEPMELREALDILRQGEASFMSLEADVRKRFGNDPVAFVEFAGKPENLAEMRRLKLAPEAPKVVPVAPVAPV